MQEKKKVSLVLSNGKKHEGYLIGAPVNSSGELVFTTAMVGYNEAITDPSFFGQILIFSYPLIGNYGVPQKQEKIEDLHKNLNPGLENSKIWASAIIMANDSAGAYHWETDSTMDEWLKKEGVPGIVGLDTRELVQITRSNEQVFARVIVEEAEKSRVISPEFKDFDHLNNFFNSSDYNAISSVSVEELVTIGTGDITVAIMDLGVKWNIIRHLLRLKVKVKIVPWNVDFTKVEADAWVISNGPGDPKNTDDLIDRIKELYKLEKPILGICMGNQLMALAAGANTVRMQHPHRGHNKPVYLFGTLKGYMTSQNHGFVVEKESLLQGWKPWFVDANDETLEGIKHEELPFWAVQFHPEAAGGPYDTQWLFDDFIDMAKKIKNCK